MRRITFSLVAALALACAPNQPPETPPADSKRVDIARAVLGAVLSMDRLDAESERPIYLIRESRAVTFAAGRHGAPVQDPGSEPPEVSWGTDLERIVRGTKVRPGSPPPSITGCPTATDKFGCRPVSAYTRYFMSQPDITSTGEALVAVTGLHHRRGDPRPFGLMRVFGVVRTDTGWRVARVDTTGVT